MSSDQVATLALALESNQFNAGLQHSQALMRGLGLESTALTSVLKQTGVALTSLVAGNKAVQAMSGALRLASAAREDLAQFNHVMRNTTKVADEMVKALTSTAYGRTTQQAQQMLMGLTSLAKGMGMTDKAAAKLSGEFSKMAVDIGSFMMVDPENVMSAFQSALMGNTMALRTYGVFLSDTLLKEKIAENAKKGMVFADQRQARANAILTETYRQQADAVGDFAVEAGQYGNQMKQFTAGMRELGVKFGTGFLEPANKVLTATNNIIDRLRALDDTTWKTISGLTAVGTAAVVTFGAYKVGTTAVALYRGAKLAAAEATARQTAALVANTAAARANNAAHAAGGALLGATAATRTGAGANIAGGSMAAGMAAIARHSPTMLPFARQEAILNRQAESLRIAHSKAAREAVIHKERYDSMMQKYTNTGDTRYLVGASESYRREKMSVRQRNNLEHNMGTLNVARNRNNTARRVARQINSQTIARNMMRRSRYNRAMRYPITAFSNVGRGIGRGIGHTAAKIPYAAAAGAFLQKFGSMALHHAPTFFKTLGVVGLKALNPIGWGAAIIGGLSVVGNYLPTLMYKAYDGFVSLWNNTEFWDKFKKTGISALSKMWEFAKSGLYGLWHIFESALYTTINTITLGATQFKSSGYVAHEAQGKTNEIQAKLNEHRETFAKREKQVAEFRMKVSDTEREWLKREEENWKKRSELAAGRFDSVAKGKVAVKEHSLASAMTSSIEFAMKNVRQQMESVEREVERATNDDTRQAAIEKHNALSARMEDLRKQKATNQISLTELGYSLFDAKFESITKLTGYGKQIGEYGTLLSGLQNDPLVRQQEIIEAEMERAYRVLENKQQALNYAIQQGDDRRTGALRGEIQSAEENLESIKAAYKELQANLSDQRKVQEQIRELYKEQMKKFKAAKDNLWQFEYEHASKAVQQQMARSAFFQANNQFEGAKTDEDRDTALQDMQTMYGKLRKEVAEMPVWNGMIRSTAGAVESDSIAAQELQNRILNDFNKVLVDNAVKQTVLLETLKAAMAQVVKNTDPNQQRPVGGSAGGYLG